MSTGPARHWMAWGQYMAAAAAYAACYDVALHLSSSYWLLTAGLRLSCLLLVPIRFWPALAFGEALPLVEHSLLCLDQFGRAWALAASVPTIVLCMATIKPLRKHWGVWAADGTPRMTMVVIAALLLALTNALRDTTAVAIILSSSATPVAADISLAVAFSAYLLGAYLGALTLTPAILAIHQRTHGLVPSFQAMRRSPLFRDLIWVLPLFVALAWSANHTQGAAQQIARLALIIPVFFMAYRHGWHGTALAGFGASIAMAMTSHVVRDPALIQCQVALALALTSGLLWRRKALLANAPQAGCTGKSGARL